MFIEDIASQSSVIIGIQHDWRDPISGVHVSPGSAETLARRGGITNYHLLAYFHSNVSAKNYENWLMCVEVTSVLFFWDRVYMWYYTKFDKMHGFYHFLTGTYSESNSHDHLQAEFVQTKFNMGITLPNFVKISRSTAEMLQFFEFLKWPPQPFLNF